MHRWAQIFRRIRPDGPVRPSRRPRARPSSRWITSRRLRYGVPRTSRQRAIAGRACRNLAGQSGDAGFRHPHDVQGDRGRHPHRGDECQRELGERQRGGRPAEDLHRAEPGQEPDAQRRGQVGDAEQAEPDRAAAPPAGSSRMFTSQAPTRSGLQPAIATGRSVVAQAPTRPLASTATCTVGGGPAIFSRYAGQDLAGVPGPGGRDEVVVAADETRRSRGRDPRPG